MKPATTALIILSCVLGTIIASEVIGIKLSLRKLEELCLTTPVISINDRNEWLEWSSSVRALAKNEGVSLEKGPYQDKLDTFKQLARTRAVTIQGKTTQPYNYPYNGVRITEIILYKKNRAIASYKNLAAFSVNGPITRYIFGDVGGMAECKKRNPDLSNQLIVLEFSSYFIPSSSKR